MKLRSVLLGLLAGAVIVGPGASGAVTIEFDVSGASLERNRWFNPESHQGTAFSAGSSLTLETDADGDGVSGDYTVVESRFVIHGIYGDPTIATLTWDIVGELSGGSGHLEDYFGQEYISWLGAASYSATGTWQCDGWGCEYLTLPDGVPMPYAEMLTFMEMEPIEAVALGSWVTDGLIPTRFDVACFQGHPSDCHVVTEAVFAVTSSLDEYGYPTPMITLHVEGEAISEPATALVAAAALLALALRRRVSDTIRRHEVA